MNSRRPTRYVLLNLASRGALPFLPFDALGVPHCAPIIAIVCCVVVFWHACAAFSDTVLFKEAIHLHLFICIVFFLCVCVFCFGVRVYRVLAFPCLKRPSTHTYCSYRSTFFFLACVSLFRLPLIGKAIHVHVFIVVLFCFWT